MSRRISERRRKAIRRKRIFLGSCFAALLLIVFLIISAISFFSGKKDGNGSSPSDTTVSQPESTDSSDNSSSDNSSSQGSSSQDSTPSVSESAPSKSQPSGTSSSGSSAASKPNTTVKLDPDYEELILVNGKNPLPKNYDYEKDLTVIDNKYLCGSRNKMSKYVLPYAMAMMEAAWKDGAKLYILSPYRSYSAQSTLYENEVKKWQSQGMDRTSAEDKAATVVARPGTSEHNTGFCADFNSVNQTFENTKMFKWMTENAADYGFVLRYPKDKTDITGVIYEPWHWRFVGIKHAKKMNELGMCLEEYVEYLGNLG